MLRREKCVALGLFLVVIVLCGCSETECKEINEPTQETREISIVNAFEDKVFREYVSENFDLDNNGKLSDEEIAQVEAIHINVNIDSRYEKIQSLAGVELFSELKELVCYSCDLKKIDVSKNTKLEELILGYTKIDSLDVTNNKMLKDLDCSGTNISGIELTANTRLESVSIDRTKIEKIDLSIFPDLEYFSCVDSKISELDVTSNLKLQSLLISGTTISKIDLSQNSDLVEFCFERVHNIVEVDLSNNPNLESIYCQQSGINELDISNNPNVFEVECCDDIEVIGGENLTYFMQYPRKDKAE